MVKLYNVPINSRIDVSHLGLTEISTGKPVNELDFKHIDGIYSLCYHNENIVHLKACTEVKIID